MSIVVTCEIAVTIGFQLATVNVFRFQCLKRFSMPEEWSDVALDNLRSVLVCFAVRPAREFGTLQKVVERRTTRHVAYTRVFLNDLR